MNAPAFDVFDCELAGTQLIEASAGTGKTWNLCALVLRLLLERELAVADILVVTFTNAATAELRERVRGRIAETLARLRGAAPSADPFVDTLLARLRGPLARPDAQLIARLELALHGFDEASILTIHGFCQRALAETPLAAGMPLRLELLADDHELLMQVVHDFWRRHIAGSALSLPLAAHLAQSRFTPERLADLLRRHLAKPCSTLLWPEGLDGSIDLPDAAALAAAFAAARALWQVDRAAIVAIVEEALPRLSKLYYGNDTLATARRSWDAVFAAAQVPDTLAGLDKLDRLASTRLQPNKGLAPPAAHGFFGAAQRLLDRLDARTRALELQRARLLRQLLHDAPAQLRRIKREQRVLGFDDMLFNLHQRLHESGGAALERALRQRFAAALVDEFQDTDPLQYAIFRSIYAGSDAPLFLVGDPKQAIYSFRHADLDTYLRARADASAEHTLADNQRSTAELLHALNALFGANPNAFMRDGLRYVPVRCGARPRTPLHEAPAPPRAALQLWRLPRTADGQPLLRADAMRVSLQACAAEIARLLGSGARLGERALAGGDIAVLVRSHAHGAAMRAALAALGVGSVELSRASVYASSDAADLQCVLAAIVQPQHDGLMRAALATEALGCDAAALHALADDEAALLERIARFAGYRASWLAHGVGRMLREWMRGEGVSARLLQRPDGPRRLTNLRHLAECLHEASPLHPSPEALLRWLQAQRSQTRHDEAAQLRLESDSNLVQVVTIHKAKGLEYPFVFCPLLWDGHVAPRRGGEGLEYHDQTGQGVIDLRTPDKPTLDAVKQRLALRAAEETMRLIYVALTRAVHRCTLVVGTYLARSGSGAPSVTQSVHARLNWLVAGAGMTPQQWLKHKLPPEAIEQAWADLARQHAPHVRLDALPDVGVAAPGAAPGTALASQALPPQRLAALPLPAAIPRAWWIGSYSALAHGARHDAAALDHDLRAEAETTTTTSTAADDAASLPDDDFLHFARGAVAGDLMHALFERVDFGDDTHWGAAVDAVLRRFGPGLPDGDAALRRRMLLRLLRQVLHAKLPGGLRLAELPPRRKLVELEFHLSAPRLDADALTRTLRRLGHAAPRYGFGTLQGYLRGFIDLVFEHQGRYHVLDWKSNHLGTAPGDYDRDALQRAMDDHGYTLQALIYALALHRHLGQRLAGYSHERHFGGVVYLFVRGMRADWTQPDGSSLGVHAQRPTLHALETLSALLDGRELAA